MITFNHLPTYTWEERNIQALREFTRILKSWGVSGIRLIDIGAGGIVAKYAPKVKASGEELVEIVKNINKGLFNQGEKVVLSPKQLKSIENKLKINVKKFLPPEAQKLYTSWSQNKLISDIMKDSVVQKLVMRTSLGAVGAGGAALGAGLVSEEPLPKVLIESVIAALAGAAAGRATGSVGLKTILGSGLKTAAAVAGQITKTALIEDIKTKLKEKLSEE